ncbi:hypothetical protein B484DRAFT_198622 [Ochromonadaceae sp. CCMP2298]|nr:hypothetical protein B484DRAFT_198622 [Ochromonadaceae sp. CCMP2298]
MKLFLGVLLLAALPIKSVVAYLRTAAVLKEDERLFHVFETCNRIELIEVSARVHYEKNEMIITRQISRDQFSTFIFTNGMYIECKKLQAALESGISVFQSTLKARIESYSGATLDDKDVSRFARAMSYLILPEDMQAAVRVKGVINDPVLGLATYLQQYPRSRQLIISLLLKSSSSSISCIWQLGSYNILSGALFLAREVKPLSASVATLGNALSNNYDVLVGESWSGKMMESRFVPLAAAFFAQAEIDQNEGNTGNISELQDELGSIADNLVTCRHDRVSGGTLGSAIDCMVDTLGSKCTGMDMRWFTLPVQAAVRQAYKSIQVLDWYGVSFQNHEKIYLDVALEFIEGEGEADFFQLAVHLEVIRLHREGLLVHKGPCDVPADQRDDTILSERSCSTAKYTCFDPLEYTCYFRADLYRLELDDLLYEVFAFYNTLESLCPDLPRMEVRRRKLHYLVLADHADGAPERELESHVMIERDRFAAEKNSDHCQTAKY